MGIKGKESLAKGMNDPVFKYFFVKFLLVMLTTLLLSLMGL
jgi:hypothetical protein